MKPVSLRWTIGVAVAAVTLATGPAAMAQTRQFTPGTDCSKVPQSQQVDCNMQQQQDNSVLGPGPSTLPLPAGNGTGTNQNGTLGPNGGSGQTNGSSSGAGGGNGGASPPGQSTN